MMGTVVQVNISPGGVPKRPIAEGMITPLGIEGDGHAHPEVHGGPQQAVLLLCLETIEELKAEGFAVYPGALGENLTVEGLDRRRIRIGQRYRAGDAILEITKIRRPCKTIGVYGEGIQNAIYDAQVKAGDPTSSRWGRSGFLAAVVRGGRVSEGAPVVLLDETA